MNTVNVFFHRQKYFIILFSFLTPSFAGEVAPQRLSSNPVIQQVVESSVARVVAEFQDRGMHSNQLAVTLIDCHKTNQFASGNHRGSSPIYPASVVKLFYLVAVHHWLEIGKLKPSAEIDRAMHDMIVDSSNDATHYLVDLLTRTTSGPELAEAELDSWFYNRNAVNRFFTEAGFTGINANRKPWCEGPYGREKQSLTKQQPGRNMLTTDATARLLLSIAMKTCITHERSEAMLRLLSRDPFPKNPPGDEQAVKYIGAALKPGMSLWSKAGWTSETRHDAAFFSGNGVGLVLVIFTTGHSNEPRIIPAAARHMLDALAAK